MPSRNRNGETQTEEPHGATGRSHAELPEHTTTSGAASFATTALVLGGIALLQPELAAGMAVGAGVALISGHLPAITGVMRPMVKAAVQAAYSAAEVVARATEELQDMVAEARAEHEPPPSKPETQMTH